MLARSMTGLANGMALLGGAVLCAVIVLVCLSIMGRAAADLAHAGGFGPLGQGVIDAGIGPILGDFELVEAGVGFAIFAFLPLTQLRGAHAKVDVFTAALGPGANRAISAFWAVVMAAVVILITWRLWAGLGDKLRYGETTYLIQFPVWWAYAACLLAAIAASIVAVYVAATSLKGARAK